MKKLFAVLVLFIPSLVNAQETGTATSSTVERKWSIGVRGSLDYASEWQKGPDNLKPLLTENREARSPIIGYSIGLAVAYSVN